MEDIGQAFEPVVHPKVGTPQGGVISPLLANLYGEHLDRGLDRMDLPFLRYADNLLVAYPSSMGEGEILAILTRLVPRGIELHKGKTQYLIGHGTLVTLGCVISRGGEGLKLYICEGYKQEAAPGKEARLQRPWADITYVKGALGWLRNLAIHFKHQYLEDRDRWAHHVGLRRLYWMVEDSSGIKPGVYREVRLTGPKGIKVSKQRPDLEVREWFEGSLRRVNLTSQLDHQCRTLQRLVQWLGPWLNQQAASLREVRTLLKVSRVTGDAPLVELLTLLAAVYKSKSARYQQELHARVWVTRVRKTGNTDGLSPATARGVSSGVFLPLSSSFIRPPPSSWAKAKVSNLRNADSRVADWKALYGPEAWFEET
jgi:hypothetical protein